MSHIDRIHTAESQRVSPQSHSGENQQLACVLFAAGSSALFLRVEPGVESVGSSSRGWGGGLLEWGFVGGRD